MDGSGIGPSNCTGVASSGVACQATAVTLRYRSLPHSGTLRWHRDGDSFTGDCRESRKHRVVGYKHRTQSGGGGLENTRQRFPDHRQLLSRMEKSPSLNGYGIVIAPIQLVGPKVTPEAETGPGGCLGSWRMPRSSGGRWSGKIFW